MGSTLISASVSLEKCDHRTRLTVAKIRTGYRGNFHVHPPGVVEADLAGQSEKAS